jgi:hypothetical protein
MTAPTRTPTASTARPAPRLIPWPAGRGQRARDRRVSPIWGAAAGGGWGRGGGLLFDARLYGALGAPGRARALWCARARAAAAQPSQQVASAVRLPRRRTTTKKGTGQL